jgi:hypothetical protein
MTMRALDAAELLRRRVDAACCTCRLGPLDKPALGREAARRRLWWSRITDRQRLMRRAALLLRAGVAPVQAVALDQFNDAGALPTLHIATAFSRCDLEVDKSWLGASDDGTHPMTRSIHRTRAMGSSWRASIGGFLCAVRRVPAAVSARKAGGRGASTAAQALKAATSPCS